MDFYQRIITLCKRKGVSRSKMADDIGISRSTPKDWLDKGSIPQFSTIKKIADYFGVSVEELTEENHSVTANNIQDNHGVIGVTHAPVTINNGNGALGEIEVEILALCGKMNMKQKTALLTRAYELLENV